MEQAGLDPKDAASPSGPRATPRPLFPAPESEDTGVPELRPDHQELQLAPQKKIHSRTQPTQNHGPGSTWVQSRVGLRSKEQSDETRHCGEWSVRHILFRIRSLTVTELYTHRSPFVWAACGCRTNMQQGLPWGTKGLWFIFLYPKIPRPVLPARQVWIPSIRDQRVNRCVNASFLLVEILFPELLSFNHPAFPSALMVGPTVVGTAGESGTSSPQLFS